VKFKVTVSREFKEFGEITVDAPDEQEARETAIEAMLSGDEGIEWAAAQDPGDQHIESVEALI
jgi:hypothetical protein